MQKSAIILTAISTLAFAQVARADTYTCTYNGVNTHATSTIYRNGSYFGNYYAAEMSLTVEGTVYDAYCVDLDHSISSGSSYEANLLPLGTDAASCAIGYILANYPASSDAQGAANQIAIWKLVYDPDPFTAPEVIYSGNATHEAAADALITEAWGECAMTCNESSFVIDGEVVAEGEVEVDLLLSSGAVPVEGQLVTASWTDGLLSGTTSGLTDNEGYFTFSVAGVSLPLEVQAVTEGMDVYEVAPLTYAWQSLAAFIPERCTISQLATIEPDNCPGVDNPDQGDSDEDGAGDACDPCPLDPQNDADGDGVCGDVDICEGGDDNVDTDHDLVPDFCDVCPLDTENDADGDGVCESDDNCDLFNPDQDDFDADGIGDECETADLDAFCTFTQGGWGAKAAGYNPGWLRDTWFSSAFPTGLVVGGDYTATFTTARAIDLFLPAGKTAGVFGSNYINPSSTTAGVLGGQVVALSLNVGFDLAGLSPEQSDIPLGKLPIASGPFAGLTVSELLDLANLTIGGDSSGLAAYGVTLSDLNNAVTSVNEAFDNCVYVGTLF